MLFTQPTVVSAVLMLIAGFALGENTGPTSLQTPLDWPPTVDSKCITTQSLDGRPIVRYVHGVREAWGYPTNDKPGWGYPAAQESGPGQQNHNSFYVVAPKSPREQTPLCVVLHSANRTAYDYLGYACLDRKVDGSDEPAAGVTNPPEDFYGLFLNSTNDEWWGWSQARGGANFGKHINAPSPAELRVLDTIEWVLTHYHIDRNRIYLCGVSMGGCGSLGIGMPHGDLFAAMRVGVPAGTEYAAYRMGGIDLPPASDAPQTDREAWLKRASGFGLPDPPVIVDFSSQIDSWSQTQPLLMEAAQSGHLPLLLAWGPFGHTGSGNVIGKYPLCQITLAFPWLEIRKNQAYPVFTHATCDQRAPWVKPSAEFDESGQTNSYFRWKSQQDTASRFAMQIWIAHPTVKTPPAAMPDSATADVTPRRLQQFKVRQETHYTWQLSRDGHTVGSGTITPDAANLLTIPKVMLTTTPTDLSIKPVEP